MKQFRLLADYRQFKAGDIVSGYVETLDFNGVLDVNLVTEINGQEKLIPIKFVEPVESSVTNKINTSEALYWVGVIIIVAILFLAAKSFFKWK